MHYIELEEKELISMDDDTGDVVIPRDRFVEGSSIDPEEVVKLSYDEDPEDIIHVYTVKSVDEENNTVALKWVKQLGESLLTEAPVVKLDSTDLTDPTKVDFKDVINKAVEAERVEAENAANAETTARLKTKYAPVAEKLHVRLNGTDSAEYIIDHIFDELVPPAGPAETVGGELLRAIVRILVRDSNDGDKFFEGYGLTDTCGSSAEYLFDHGFAEDIQNILDQAYILSDDDTKYTDAIQLVAQHVLETIDKDNSLLWTLNTEDSRDYSNEYITEHQPKYELELTGSDDIVTLVDKGVLTSWDLIRYAESQLEWEAAYRDAEVDRPWSHHDTSVSVSNLTRDGYDLLKDNFTRNPEGWWEDLVSEHADKLTSSDYDDDYEDNGAYDAE